MDRPTCKDCYWFPNIPELDECAVYWEGFAGASAEAHCCDRFFILTKDDHGWWNFKGTEAVCAWFDGRRNEVE